VPIALPRVVREAARKVWPCPPVRRSGSDVRSNWRSAAQVRRVKGGLLRLRVNSWALLSEVLELGRWRVFARLPPAMLFNARKDPAKLSASLLNSLELGQQ
jgi:hypothetical protein